MTQIPAKRLFYITVVVKDLRTAASKMARLYGITDWQVINEPQHLSNQMIQGYHVPYTIRTATGSAETEAGPVTFQLVQPIDGWSTYQEFLLTRSEGVLGVCIAEISPQEFAQLAPWLKEQGVKVAQSDLLEGVVARYQLDTREALGGFYIELLVPKRASWRDEIKLDETWDLSSDVPKNGPLLPIGEFRHFGVVVRDLMKVVPAWNRLFGYSKFTFMNWHNAADSLVNPVYKGQPVNHAYFTTTPTIGNMLTFELIQPTFGPSHYKEDFLLPLGEGIHHLYTGRTANLQEWKEIEQRMLAEGAPVCMGGGLGDDFAEFYYLDTRKVLPGYVTEYVYRGKNAGSGRPPFKPAMIVDLGIGEKDKAS